MYLDPHQRSTQTLSFDDKIIFFEHEGRVVNLKQLQYFCFVVDYGTAHLAADALHVVPTAVSMQISQLEGVLGGKLFDRTTRPMSLTPLGRFLYPKAKRILAEVRGTLEQSCDFANGRTEWLSVGFTRSTMFSILPPIVQEFTRKEAGARIDLTELLTEHQCDALRKGEIHIGLARSIDEVNYGEDIEKTPLFEEPLLVAISKTLDVETTSLQKLLCNFPFIRYPKGTESDFSESMLKALRTAGVAPVVRHEAKEIHTALGMVAAGLGFTIVVGSVATNSRPDLQFLKLNALTVRSKFYALRLKNMAHGLADVFMSIFKSHLKNADYSLNAHLP